MTTELEENESNRIEESCCKLYYIKENGMETKTDYMMIWTVIMVVYRCNDRIRSLSLSISIYIFAGEGGGKE